MPQRQSTAAQAARTAARRGGKFTSEFRRKREEQERRRSRSGGPESPDPDRYRFSPARQRIFEALVKLQLGLLRQRVDDDHAPVLMDYLDKAGHSVTLSYFHRTMSHFQGLGISHISMSGWGAPIQYYLTSAGGHLHLACEQCGGITEIGPAATLDPATALELGYSFDPCEGHLTVSGRCDSCRKRRRRSG